MKSAKVTSYQRNEAADPRDLVASDLMRRIETDRTTATLLCRRLAHSATKEQAGAYTASFKHPSSRNNAQLRVLHELYERVESLKSLVEHISHGFDGWSEIEPIKVKAQSTLTRLSTRVDTAIEKLSRCSERHQPAQFKNIVTAVQHALNSKFAGRFDDLRTIALVRVVETDENVLVGTQFTTYLCLRNFTDDKGYTYPVFHVVLTCLVSPSGRYSVNVCTQPQLILPGKFKSGVEASSVKNTVEVTLEALSKHGFNLTSAPKDT